jgi:hypothetical protein
MCWLTGYRRLTLRYEREDTHFLGFLFLGAGATKSNWVAKVIRVCCGAYGR